MHSFEEAYAEFTAYVEIHGWQRARVWLLASSGLPVNQIEAILSKAAKGNIEKIRIHASDLTGNRMRKTAELR